MDAYARHIFQNINFDEASDDLHKQWSYYVNYSNDFKSWLIFGNLC